jgi:hypothetical protein
MLGTARVAPEKAVFRPALPLLPLPEFTGEQQMAHGAIQTEYKGHLFRSRLEARWAVFLDALEVEWRYEEQGYETDGHRYLPDFYLPDSRAWLEVKGDPGAIGQDSARMCAILSDRSPLPGFASGDAAVVVVGEIPQAHDGCTLHSALARLDGSLTATWACVVKSAAGPFKFAVMKPHLMFGLFQIPVMAGLDKNPAGFGALPANYYLFTPGNWPQVRNAYTAARQARFEHGARGSR